MNRTQDEETGLDAASKRDTSRHDPDQLFEQIEEWPERFGTPEWRKRAHRDLDVPVHEAFIAYSTRKKYLSGEESDADNPDEWKLFNSKLAKLSRRRKSLNAISGFLDGVTGVAAVCTPIWLAIWYFAPSPSFHLSIVLIVHLAILAVWAIVRLFRWRYNSREKRKLRFANRSAADGESDAVIQPLRYTDDRIPACEFEGRKYRSNALLNKAMNESHERRQYEQVGREAQKPGTERSMEWIINVFMGVIALGFLGLLEGGREGHAPLWLSIVLIVLGGIGFFLTVRLRDRLHDAKHRYYSAGLQWFDTAGRSHPAPGSQSSRPSLPR